MFWTLYKATFIYDEGLRMTRSVSFSLKVKVAPNHSIFFSLFRPHTTPLAGTRPTWNSGIEMKVEHNIEGGNC